LERKIETLGVQLNEERKVNSLMEKDADQKIIELQSRIKSLAGGEKLKVQEELKKVQESKEKLLEKQRDLEKGKINNK